MEIIQFHPEYSYQDFIQGIRPETTSSGQITYKLSEGRFLNFCNRAIDCQGKCILIIDEINRANLARVFGELMYLLEYRSRKIPLAGGGQFAIPNNVRIIGTMNTADRSIALVDHALRRRFAFIPLYPCYGILRYFHKNTSFYDKVDELIDILKYVNRQIYDPHYEIGISFFLHDDLNEEKLDDIWRMEIEPYLEEYFFDQQEKIENCRWDKLKTKIVGQL